MHYTCQSYHLHFQIDVEMTSSTLDRRSYVPELGSSLIVLDPQDNYLWSLCVCEQWFSQWFSHKQCTPR